MSQTAAARPPSADGPLNDAPVTWEDLERWLDAEIGKITRWGLAGLLAVVFGAGLTYASMRGEVAALQLKVADMDRDGTRSTRGMQVQIDSLRLEMRYLPGRIADELERRRAQRNAERAP